MGPRDQAPAAESSPRALRVPAAPRRQGLLDRVTAALAFAGCLACTAPLRAADADVTTRPQGDLIAVRAQATLPATMPVVWGTLTDYERLPEFIPGLHSSTVLSRRGPVVTVRQRGEASFLFLSVPVDVTVESTERMPVIEVRRIAGTLRHLQGRYEVEALPGQAGVRLRWTGTIAPAEDLPPLVGEALVRMSLREQFRGLVDEIARRQGLNLPPGVPPPPPPALRPRIDALPAQVPDNR